MIDLLSLSTVEYPEERGYSNEPGWVKGNPLNNDSYLLKALEVYPSFKEDILTEYERLLGLGKPFNLTQIKVKFNDIRIYSHLLD